MPRFVVLHHQPGDQTLRQGIGAHFDWMFQVDQVLQTWATATLNDFDQPVDLPATKLPDHRLLYLEFEGEISGGRGTVRRVLSGTFTVTERNANGLKATLRWTDATGRSQSRCVELYRSFRPIWLADDETRDAWGLRLDSCR